MQRIAYPREEARLAGSQLGGGAADDHRSIKEGVAFQLLLCFSMKNYVEAGELRTGVSTKEPGKSPRNCSWDD